MIEGKTKLVICRGQHVVTAACSFLVAESTPFEVEPHPNDQWAITMKDNGHPERVCELFGNSPNVVIF